MHKIKKTEYAIVKAKCSKRNDNELSHSLLYFRVGYFFIHWDTMDTTESYRRGFKGFLNAIIPNTL